MFIYNFKINGGKTLKIIIVILSLFMLGVFLISVYRIFFTKGKFIVNDEVKAKEITEIEADNYANILQAVHEDLNSYIGLKIKFTGYVYRVLDFTDEQFVLARDMLLNENKTQSVVIGFLSQYKNAQNFENGTWVELTGTIERGKYHNEEIPIINVTEMHETDEPEDNFVPPPSNTYIPTSALL